MCGYDSAYNHSREVSTTSTGGSSRRREVYQVRSDRGDGLGGLEFRE